MPTQPRAMPLNGFRFLPHLRCSLLLLLLLLLGACSKPVPTEEPVRAVKVVTVGLQGVQSGAEFAGEVRARVESRLGFRVGGKIIQRPVDAGQRVKAGQVLAQLDAQDFRLAADAAKAQVAAAATNRDLAQADYKRYKELKDQNFISGAEVERRDTTLKAAQAQLEQAQAQLSSQSNQTKYTALVADASGVVMAVEAERGQVVAAGTTIFRIAQDGPRDVVFSVPEDRVALVKMGAPVAVRSWSAGPALKGAVREVAASADPVTRTYQVKVSLDAGEAREVPPLGSTVYVSPEAFARAEVQVIKLPTSALKRDGKTTAVWVLEPASMTLRSQSVEVVTADGNDAIISSGLKPGMLVVAAGVHVLQAGQKVILYKDKSSSAVDSSQLSAIKIDSKGAAPALAPSPAGSGLK
jgi:membrane fusion protein, multidrug efflux system